MGNKCCGSIQEVNMEYSSNYKKSEKTLMMKIILIQRIGRGFIVRKEQQIYNMKVIKTLHQYSVEEYNEKVKKYGLFVYNMTRFDGQIHSFISDYGYCGEVISGDTQYRLNQSRSRVKNGRGIMIKQGIIFEGHWINDLQEGRGRMITDDMIYDGEWQQGLQNGIGIEQWNDGSCFIGQFSNGSKCSGKMEWISQSGDIDATYNGQFRNDKMQGEGQYDSTTRFYKGQWNQNQMEGYGQLLDKINNKMYIGQFRNNKKQGIGLQIEPEILSIGYFKNNKQQSKGMCVKQNEFMWLEWKDGSIINQFTDQQVYQDKQFMMFYDIHQLFINNGLNQKVLDDLEEKYQLQMDNEIELVEQKGYNISYRLETKLDPFNSFPIKTMNNLKKQKSENRDRLQVNNQSTTFQWSPIQTGDNNNPSQNS